MDSNRFDIFDIYRRYCDILSGNTYACGSEDYREDGESQGVKLSRESLAKFLKLVESRVCSRHSIIDELQQLMLRLDLMGDFSEFSRFYGFVFFMCRENGQKNITVTKAINAWKLILSGRFRLLDQWCDFLQKNQRHNISEDTWRQVLAFSRCVHENFEGYDPEGAWPVVIDDFVEYMYRMTGNSDNPNLSCNCGDSEAQTCQNKVPLPGIVEGPKTHNDLKRKFIEGHGLKSPERYSCSTVMSPISKLKRMKQFFAVNNTISFEKSPSSPLSSTQSPCAVEGGLSKGFAGLFSVRPPLQFDQKST